MVRYHDEEWGTPCHDDVELFERLALESFQAGLSLVDDPPQARRLPDARSAASIRPSSPRSTTPTERGSWPTPGSSGTGRRSTRRSATPRRGWRSPREFGSVDAYLATMVPGAARPARPRRGVRARSRPRTAVSDALSADLRRRGFRFVGSTIVYAFMQSVGLVDDHLPGCFRYGHADDRPRPAVVTR